VTFDSDFFDLSLIMGFPPKIIWIRTGNLTRSIVEILLPHQQQIFDFMEFGKKGVLEILKQS
jgi:predicted nuclease of predicted toxin-antitoxin system